MKLGTYKATNPFTAAFKRQGEKITVKLEAGEEITLAKSENGKALVLVGMCEGKETKEIIPVAVHETLLANVTLEKAADDEEEYEFVDDEEEGDDDDDDDDYEESLAPEAVKALTKEILDNPDKPVREIIHTFRESQKA